MTRNNITFSFEQFKRKVEIAMKKSNTQEKVVFDYDTEKEQYKATIYSEKSIYIFGKPSSAKICVIVNHRKFYE